MDLWFVNQYCSETSRFNIREHTTYWKSRVNNSSIDDAASIRDATMLKPIAHNPAIKNKTKQKRNKK